VIVVDAIIRDYLDEASCSIGWDCLPVISQQVNRNSTPPGLNFDRRLKLEFAKVEWHPGELCPTVGFIVTNMTRPAERVVAFYNQSGTAEQWIKEGKNAIKWTRLSCCSFAANAVRLQPHALAYNLANFMRTLALPEAVKQWSLTSLREKLVKIGAKVVRHAVTSSSRWPRSRCRKNCSRKSCG